MSLKGTRIDEYSQKLSQEDREQIIEDNFSALRAALNFTGISNIVEQSDETEILMASPTSETSVPGYSKAFRTSGGMTEVIFDSNVYFNGASTIALYIDERRRAWANFHAATHASISLRWSGSLASGPHKVDVRVTSTGGHNIEIGHDDSSTRMTVMETIL